MTDRALILAAGICMRLPTGGIWKRIRHLLSWRRLDYEHIAPVVTVRVRSKPAAASNERYSSVVRS